MSTLPIPTWRSMTPADLPAVDRLASTIHTFYPEEPTIFAERLKLYPAGCWLLEVGTELLGYAISHPWLTGQPPALNSLLGTLPAQPTTFYIHDVALLPHARNMGEGTRIVTTLFEHARQQGLPTASGVAVNHSTPFWQKLGSTIAPTTPELAAKMHSYGNGAHYMVHTL